MAEDAAESAPQGTAVATTSTSRTPDNGNAVPSPTSMDVDTPIQTEPASNSTLVPVLAHAPSAEETPSNAEIPAARALPEAVASASDPTPPQPADSLAAALAAAAASVPEPTAPSDTTAPSDIAAPQQPQPSPPKRSRSPEPGEDNGAEKRQKTKRNTEDVENKVENNETISDAAGWDLEAMLSSALGSLNSVPAKESSPLPEAPPAEATTKIEVVEAPPPPMLPPLPPPPPIRKREPERMKFIENPSYFVRAMGLPLLGSLAVQILLALFQQPSEVTDKHIRDQRTEGGKVYLALRSTFMATLKLFAESTHFLSADDLDIQNPGDRETIQMANLANMCASFYGPGGPTMATAHDYFLRIMIPETGMITEDISMLYLDQKTQSFLAYANVMDDKEATRASLMDKFFPLDLEDKLREHYRESQLTISADEFVRPHTDRRNLLKAIGHDKDKRKALETKYPFSAFLDNLSAFIRSNFAAILEFAESHGIDIPCLEDQVDDLMLMDGPHGVGAYSSSFPGQQRPGARINGAASANGETSYEAQGLASLIAEKLNGGYDAGSAQSAAGQMYNGQYLGQYHNQQQYYQYQQGGPSSAAASGNGAHLPPTQSLPTAILYERARQAAVAKSSAHARREGLHSTRRPWTPEEEKALMAGLDMVKGPHWSQILQLFGQHGTISDILKDRTQVQLKDKARNLKLFFLKTNSEMPYYLQCVTGELKTRAPTQAARKEAEERARMNSEEEQARIQGIMTLAGGLQNNHATNPSNGSASSSTHTIANNLPAAGSARASPAMPGVNTTGTSVSAPSPLQHQHHQVPHQHLSQKQHVTNTHVPPLAPGQVKSEPQRATSIQAAHHQAIAPTPRYQPQAQHQQYQAVPVSATAASTRQSAPTPALANTQPVPAPVKQESGVDTPMKTEASTNQEDDEYLKSALTAAINGDGAA